MTNKFKINLIKGNNILGVNFYTGVIKVEDLCNAMDIAVYSDSASKFDGYQRKPSKQRRQLICDKIIEDLANKEGPSPLVDSLNINIRAKDAEQYVTAIDKANDCINGFHSLNYTETLGPLWVQDGQHRCEGLKLALNTLKMDDLNAYNELKDMYVTVNLILTSDIFIEAYVFYLINEHAKKVSADGAIRLLVDGYNSGSVVFKNEVTSNFTKSDADDISAGDVTDMLRNNSNVWSSRIRDYNETGADQVSIAAMTKMIKQLYLTVDKYNTSTQITSVQQTFDIVDAAWSGLQQVFPTMFTGATSKTFNITKSSQAEVIMGLIRFVFNETRPGNRWPTLGVKVGDVTKATWWHSVFKELKSYQATNATGNSVTGPDNWKVGQGGSMSGSSAALKRSYIKSLIEHIEDKIGIAPSYP